MVKFISSGNITIDKVYIHPIWESEAIHPHNDGLSMLYIYDITNDTELVINLKNIDNHTTTLDEFTFKFNESYVYDNKSFLNILQLDNSVDAGLIKYLQSNSQLKSSPTPTHTFYHRRFGEFKGVNNLIPTSKHLEMIRDVRNEFLQYYDLGWDSNCVKKFSNFYIKSLHLVERNGAIS